MPSFPLYSHPDLQLAQVRGFAQASVKQERFTPLQRCLKTWEPAIALCIEPLRAWCRAAAGGTGQQAQ